MKSRRLHGNWTQNANKLCIIDLLYERAFRLAPYITQKTPLVVLHTASRGLRSAEDRVLSTVAMTVSGAP